MGATRMLWIGDEHRTTVRLFNGLSPETAAREALEWLEVYQDKGWVLDPPAVRDQMVLRRDGRFGPRERTIAIYESEPVQAPTYDPVCPVCGGTIEHPERTEFCLACEVDREWDNEFGVVGPAAETRERRDAR